MSADESIAASLDVDNSEMAIRDAIGPLMSLGRVLVTVDQKGDMARLLIGVATSMGSDVAFLTPHDFSRHTDTYSEIKSDAHDRPLLSRTEPGRYASHRGRCAAQN
jgi:ornithine carbamoyltransferase